MQLTSNQQRYIKNLIGVTTKEVEVIDDTNGHYYWVYVYSGEERYKIKLLKHENNLERRSLRQRRKLNSKC